LKALSANRETNVAIIYDTRIVYYVELVRETLRDIYRNFSVPPERNDSRD